VQNKPNFQNPQNPTNPCASKIYAENMSQHRSKKTNPIKANYLVIADASSNSQETCKREQISTKVIARRPKADVAISCFSTLEACPDKKKHQL